jgi:hypothetical protein
LELAALLASQALAAATTYYLDADKGSDENKGTSPQSAWKSLDKANARSLAPGDSLLLKRGCVFRGNLAPKGSGREGAPIILGAYGEGARPVVSAPAADNPKKLAAITLFNQEYWTLRDLETVGGNTRGIFVSGNVANGLIRGISILDCYAHGVGGESTVENDKDNGCIILSTGFSNNTQFEGALIEGCEAADTKRWAGIMIFGAYDKTGRSALCAIRSCVAHDVYGDGIVMFECSDGVIEDCVAYECGKAPVKKVGTANGIWCWSSDRVVIQRCEAYRIHSPDIDGGGFDIDYSCHDCVIQHCYAHDNDGYGASIFGAMDDYFGDAALGVTSGAILRYNVLANNCRSGGKATMGDFYLGTWNKGAIAGARIYGNVSFWNPNGSAPALAAAGVTFAPGTTSLFRDNIVYSNSRSLVQVPEKGIELDGNCYYYAGTGMPIWKVGETAYGSFAIYTRTTGQDQDSLVDDPRLAAPTYHGVGDRPSAYALVSTSPCLGAGLPVEGEAPSATADIGAYQGSGVAAAEPPVPAASVGLDKSSLQLKAGDAVPLRAFVRPDEASDVKVAWDSSDESIAKVSINGTVTARKEGKATITAVTEDGGFQASCEVSVAVVTRVVDELGDFGQMESHSSGWYADGKDSDKWQNRDTTRICPFFGIGTDQDIVYHLGDIGSFEMVVGYCVADIVHDPAKYRFTALASPDGSTWTPVPVKSGVDDNKKWLLTTYSPAGSLPAGTNYLKFVFYDNEKGWTTELSKVTILTRGDPEFRD